MALYGAIEVAGNFPDKKNGFVAVNLVFFTDPL